jgi:signal transduction histidine kinase
VGILSAGARDLEQSRRLERGLIRVRWFGVALGVYLTSQTNSGSPPFASQLVLRLSYATIGVLALGNILVWVASNRARSVAAINRVGLAAFALDAAVLCALAWVFSYDPRGNTWVVMYILPLIGALRYRLQGALVSVAITLANEIGREVFLAARFSHSMVVDGAHIDRYSFLLANVAFRVGIEAIIALVAGFMSRSLAKEAEKAAEQARRFQDLARRESAIRSEMAAFNTAILAGVAAEDLDSSLGLMSAAVGRDLGFETFSIFLREGDDLVAKGMYGLPFLEGRLPFGNGVVGTVAASGTPLIVPDVSAFPAYIMSDPEVRSEMAAPMRFGDELIGVVDVESRTPNAFDDEALGVLTRLADQIALVAHSNRLLSQQRETMRRLRELDQMKSDFVAITSHELRTPITAIRGFVKTLLRNRDRLSDDQVENFMHIIDRQSGRLARLVEDLLFVSRIEAGTIRLQMETVELSGFLHEAVEALGPEGKSRVRFSLSPPDAAVVMDPQRMDQIVRNLVENALKFSPPESQVDIDASMSDGQLTLAIIDRGAGIPAEDLPNIFDRFHQTGEVLTREAEGAGLGLYITKRLAEAMGGSVSVSSVLGTGSTFVVAVPAGLMPEPVQDGQAAARSAPNASARSGS